jgi:hypothetical protein
MFRPSIAIIRVKPKTYILKLDEATALVSIKNKNSITYLWLTVK